MSASGPGARLRPPGQAGKLGLPLAALGAVMGDGSRQVVKAGISFGSALAIVISWTANKSLLWAIVHGLLSWLYVIYYALRYHFRMIG